MRKNNETVTRDQRKLHRRQRIKQLEWTAAISRLEPMEISDRRR
jgi:hypothetical protein